MKMGKRPHDAITASEDGSSPGPYSRSFGPDDHNYHITKSVVIDQPQSFEVDVMQCSLPPHAAISVSFPSLETFEVHYAKEHTNRCSSCGKNFPSAHFLALHLDELHNPVREALAAKGEKTYGCFLEDCGKKCSNPTKRRLHLIDKHAFPKDYNFRLVQNGIGRSTSLLREGRRRRVSTASDPWPRPQRRTLQVGELCQDDIAPDSALDVTAKTLHVQGDAVQPPSMPGLSEGTENDSGPDEQMTQLETSLSALSFIPRALLSRQVPKH